jgi:hypothetical protein
MESRHLRHPHHYIPFVGVAPAHQGAGIGTRLMQPTLDQCDHDQLPAYLEATTERNAALYAQLGVQPDRRAFIRSHRAPALHAATPRQPARPRPMTGPRLAGAAGILGVACATLGGVVIAPVWRFPATASTSEQIARYVLAHRTELIIAMALNTLGVELWLVFAAGVWSHLRRQPSQSDLLSTCFAFGMVATVTLLLTGFTALWVLICRDPTAADTRLLYDLTFGMLAMSGVPTALALLAYAAAILRTHVLPSSTAWLAITAAVAHPALLATSIPNSGFFSLEGQVITAIPGILFLWIASTATTLLRIQHPSIA